jgi:hypothetical protein
MPWRNLSKRAFSNRENKGRRFFPLFNMVTASSRDKTMFFSLPSAGAGVAVTVKNNLVNFFLVNSKPLLPISNK